MVMPKQKPHRSKQDYGTPPEFLAALRNMLGIDGFDWDLAASPENTVSHLYYTEEQNSLHQTWTSNGGWDWLNPPFADIAPWVTKAFESTTQLGTKIAMLVPASTGSNWWHDWVHNTAYVLFVRPRLTFVGCKDPYPKDLALLLYQPLTLHSGGYGCWNWKLNDRV